MHKKHPIRLVFAGLLAAAIACWGDAALAQSNTALEQRIRMITERPEFAHSRFGIKFIAADTGSVVYELNSAQLFVPGSTTKLLTEGTALELFGGDYRFHTKIYRTGPIQKDGTLAFEDHDHTYGGPDSVGLPGDPLVVMREFARQVAAKGIKRVKGRVLVDATLFPEGERELGTGVVISPIVVNDNVVDVIVGAGMEEKSAVQLKIAPQTAYVTIFNQATTGKAGSRTSLRYENEKLNPDGTRTATLTGSMAVDAKPAMAAYAVPEPSRYAATVLVEALKAEGVTSSLAAPAEQVDFKALSASYTPENAVAEHVSPPLKEDVKITLKVSHNLHAS